MVHRSSLTFNQCGVSGGAVGCSSATEWDVLVSIPCRVFGNSQVTYIFCLVGFIQPLKKTSTKEFLWGESVSDV